MNGGSTATAASASTASLVSSLQRKVRSATQDVSSLRSHWDRHNEDLFAVGNLYVNSKLKELFLDHPYTYGPEIVEFGQDPAEASESVWEENIKSIQSIKALVEKMSEISQRMRYIAVQLNMAFVDASKKSDAHSPLNAPLFRTNTFEEFVVQITKIADMYSRETELKSAIVEELPLLRDRKYAMLILSSLVHQPYLDFDTFDDFEENWSSEMLLVE